MVIKINKKLRDEVGSKTTLIKKIKDHVGMTPKEAKEVVDCLDGDQFYVIPAGLPGEDREMLFAILRKEGLDPEYTKDEDVINNAINFEDDPDHIGAHVEATEIGTTVSIRMRISQKVSLQLVGLLKDAGFSSAEKKPSIADPDSDIVAVGTNFGQGEVDIDVILNYVRDILRFKKSLEIETVLRNVIDQIGIKRALEEYKETL